MKVFHRILIILGAFVCTVGVLVGMNVLINISDGSTISVQWETWFITASVIVGTQTIFILPFVKPPRHSVKGKSLILSTCLASFIASVLTIGLVLLVYSIVMSLIMDLPKKDEIQEEIFFTILLSSWIVWSILLLIFVFRKKRDPHSLVKVTSWLFAGSLIEFLLSIPLAIIVARRSSCYCATGSFITLSLSFLASLWLIGQFMIILIVWRKRPRKKDHCFNCGYPRKIADSEKCSECGVEM